MNMTLGTDMREVSRENWPFMPSIESVPLNVWLSKDYLAVLYEQRVNGMRRLTVNKTRRDGRGWRDGITWDELQRIKNETVGEEVWCVECYPAESALVNVSNMRHLWVLDEPPATRFPERGYFSKDDVDAALGIFKALVRR